MSHSSAEAMLVWAICGCLLLSFYIFHLWKFDRFRCLKWNTGAYSGAFKRVMTYSYLLTIPLITAYAITFAVIKYQEGEILVPPFGIVPKPYQLWTNAHQNAILPGYFLFSVGWSLELVTHLEELCFWLFLVNAGSTQQDWFRSPYFKTWLVGAAVAIIYMPLVTAFTRNDLLRCEAFTFLAGGLGSLSLTLWFLPILWTFPRFLKSLRREGVDQSTIIRLTKFHELNTIRIAFRFIMCVPIVVLAIDGVRPHVHINTSRFWVDFLSIVTAFGCTISSAITLVIFFPRSIEGELKAKEASKEQKRLRSLGLNTQMSDRSSSYSLSYSASRAYDVTSGTHLIPGSVVDGQERLSYPYSPHSNTDWEEEKDDLGSLRPGKLPAIRPNRRINDNEIELGGVDRLTESNLSRHNVRESRVHPMLNNFKSPIDLAYYQPAATDSRGGSRLTFNNR